MTAPQAFETWKGELVMRTPEEALRLQADLARVALLGTTVQATTKRGRNRHVCTVVAVPEPYRYRGDTRWLSALTRARFDESPKSHRIGSGGIVLRIEESTKPEMVGRYLRRHLP